MDLSNADIRDMLENLASVAESTKSIAISLDEINRRQEAMLESNTVITTTTTETKHGG